jgi:hypothetical protein
MRTPAFPLQKTDLEMQKTVVSKLVKSGSAIKSLLAYILIIVYSNQGVVTMISEFRFSKAFQGDRCPTLFAPVTD